MLDDLRELVLCESFSGDHAAVRRSAEAVGAVGTRLLGAPPETIVIGGVSHLRWRFGELTGAPRVLVLGHHDTVWPVGSLRRLPWSVTDGVARGPGVLDMKAGLVQMFHALASLPSLDGVCVLVNGDEEVGSNTSRELIEQEARQADAAFVLEAAGDGGALKVARKGAARYEVVVRGRAAHAGVEPGRGVNAAVEAAHLVLAVAGMGGGEGGVDVEAGGEVGAVGVKSGAGGIGMEAEVEAVGARAEVGGIGARGGVGASAVGVRSGASASVVGAKIGGRVVLAGTTVTPTLLSSGTSRNTVPDLARISVDVRVPDVAEYRRVDALMRGLTARTPGARVEVLGLGGRPPMEASGELFALAALVAAGLGQEPPRGVAVGGVSDGNCTAAVGCPTLDGLGAVGGGAHADGEHVEVGWMVPRARLLAGLVAAVLRTPCAEPGAGNSRVPPPRTPSPRTPRTPRER
ncbi:M20/M25/M40 family metallo-hydrolase [Streptomyces acidiscabies]|uniref:M20/M25/M40 family metallo-hydrolase n=1 Tax=Streptomyces acidiscabies TaxID=42234 RepID=UPI00099DD50F